MGILRRTPTARRFRARGFTMVELSVAATISFMVMLSVVAIQFISARTINDLYGPTRSRTARMNALNQIRFRLCDAKMGSVVVSDAKHRIRFNNPNLGSGVTSEFYFSVEKRALYYDADISKDPRPYQVAQGPIDVTFTKGCVDLDPPDYTTPKGTDAVVTLWVRTSADLSYSRVDVRDGETAVYLRNP